MTTFDGFSHEPVHDPVVGAGTFDVHETAHGVLGGDPVSPLREEWQGSGSGSGPYMRARGGDGSFSTPDWPAAESAPVVPGGPSGSDVVGGRGVWDRASHESTAGAESATRGLRGDNGALEGSSSTPDWSAAESAPVVPGGPSGSDVVGGRGVWDRARRVLADAAKFKTPGVRVDSGHLSDNGASDRLDGSSSTGPDWPAAESAPVGHSGTALSALEGSGPSVWNTDAPLLVDPGLQASDGVAGRAALRLDGGPVANYYERGASAMPDGATFLRPFSLPQDLRGVTLADGSRAIQLHGRMEYTQEATAGDGTNLLRIGTRNVTYPEEGYTYAIGPENDLTGERWIAKRASAVSDSLNTPHVTLGRGKGASRFSDNSITKFDDPEGTIEHKGYAFRPDGTVEPPSAGTAIPAPDTTYAQLRDEYSAMERQFGEYQKAFAPGGRAGEAAGLCGGGDDAARAVADVADGARFLDV